MSNKQNPFLRATLVAIPLFIVAMVLIMSTTGTYAAKNKKRDAGSIVRLTPQNTYTLRGEINADSATEAQKALFKLVETRGSSAYPLYLVLDSPGGSIMDGLDLINAIQSIPHLNTITIFAASMASAIVEHLPGERLIAKNGTLMFHRAKGGVQGQFEDGELESRLAFYKSIVRGMEQVNADRMGKSLEAYKAAVVNELWLYGQQAVDYKAADRIVAITCSQELRDSSTVVREASFFSVINVSYSGCPLLRNGTVVEEKK